MDISTLASFQTKVLAQPEELIADNAVISADIRSLVKHIFDYSAQFISKSASAPLHTLYIDQFDADQIWEQLRLQNKPLLRELATRVRTLAQETTAIKLCPDGGSTTDEEIDSAIADERDEAAPDASFTDVKRVSLDMAEENTAEIGTNDPTSIDNNACVSPQSSGRPSNMIKDRFFNWDEMDKAAEEQENIEAEESNKGDESDDDEETVEESDSDGSGVEAKYDDFFDDESLADKADKTGETHEKEFSQDKCIESEEEQSEADDDAVAERGILLSNHQSRVQRMNKKITQLEQEAIQEKPWHLKGEVKSSDRPENSLLEALLDFERPVLAAPVTTTESSTKIEEVIKQRILEDQFDDVQRKHLDNDPARTSEKDNLSTEKSDKGLGEVYEKEYMKSAIGMEVDEESRKDQEEIEVMFKQLCWKLDALSSFHFTPKPEIRDFEVKPSVPAILMEEVLPISISDANLKAPEEILKKKRKRGEAILQVKEETTQSERKALRNAKKRVGRKKRQQQEVKDRALAHAKPNEMNEYTAKQIVKDIANSKNVTRGKTEEADTFNFTNSRSFFSSLEQKKAKRSMKVKDQSTAVHSAR